MPQSPFPRHLPVWLLALLVPALMLAAAPLARAQLIVDAPGFITPPPKAAPTPPRGATIAWPRLDAGAVLCRTQDDLERHFLAMNARLSGQAFTGTNPNCRVMVNAVGIKILSREGPGRTKVQLDNTGRDTGWTDTFLPARPPGQG